MTAGRDAGAPGVLSVVELCRTYGGTTAVDGISFELVLFLFGIALGILGCALVLRLGPAAEWFVWPIPAVVSPFAGVFYPLSVLPEWMRAIAAGRGVPWEALAWGSALAALDILLAGWVSARVYRHAVRTGLIARYSAESVG